MTASDGGLHMAVATFDTLKFANALKAAGVPEKQAEAQAAALSETLQFNLKELPTKNDLDSVKTDLMREINDVRREIKDSEQRLNAKIDSGLSDVRIQIALLKGEMLLLKWMLGVGMTISIALMGIVLRVLLIRMPI
jgi:hypothetical protein